MATAMIAAAMTATNDLRIETSCSRQSRRTVKARLDVPVSLSTTLPADHRPGIHDARRILVIRSIRRVELDGPRSNRPRFGEDVRIIHGVSVVERVPFAPEPVSYTHLRAHETPE